MKQSKLNGLLSLNARNLEMIYNHNPHRYFPMVDDKLLTKKVLQEANLPHPKLLYSCDSSFKINEMRNALKSLNSFALKPVHGRGGGGILVIKEQNSSKQFLSMGGKIHEHEDIILHAQEILTGVYSLDSEMDTAMFEEKIIEHHAFDQIAFKGIPDIRIILFQGKPLQAMLRLPTKNSDGKANLHQGGIGVGIDLQNGNSLYSICNGKRITKHPDTHTSLTNFQVPHWKDLVHFSTEVVKLFPLGYIGIDWVIDGEKGPLVLELNARPGIEIQNATGIGLRHNLRNYFELEALL